MEIIQIEKKKFDLIFKNLRTELELEKYKIKECVTPEMTIDVMAQDMHRFFNFHVCKLKSEIEKS